MGDGLVLKSGTHNDLIQASGPYARLMEFQKLREGCGLSDTDDAFGDWNKNMELKRKLARMSPLAARILIICWLVTFYSRSNKLQVRMRKTNTMDYLICSSGCSFLSAINGNCALWEWCLPVVCILPFSYICFLTVIPVNEMVYPALGVVFATGVSKFLLNNCKAHRHAGDRTALWYV
jgi:ATP-binding cassette subfamily B (MDR/TAP) protein 1